jgi:hypothetical protein
MRTKLDPYDVEEAKEYAHRELLNEKPGLRSEGDKKKERIWRCYFQGPHEDQS